MANDEASRNQEQAMARAALLRKLGFAWRRQFRGQASRSWRETVTHFRPEPWLDAVAHEKARLPVKLRDLPEANR